MARLHNKAGELVLMGSMAGAEISSNKGISANVEPAVAAQTGLRLCGYSVKAIAGQGDAIIYRGATVAGGTPIVNVDLPINTSETKWLGESGIKCSDGISIEVLAGILNVILYHKGVVD